MPAFFDSFDPAYRAPFGAVAERTPVFFRIRIPRCWGCHGAELVVAQDEKPTRRMGMFWAGMAGEDHEWWDIRFAPEEPGVYFYAFAVSLALGDGYLVRKPDGTAEYSCDRPYPLWQLTCYAEDFVTPDWLAGGIMYQIFPDRFFNSGEPKEGVPADRVMHENWADAPVWEPDALGKVLNNDYFGGDLKGVEQKLDYLASLGVTCVYLNPVFEAHSNHRYDTADYSRVDPLLGTADDLRSLTAAAKERGIRVLLDGVFSHTGADSVYFNKNGRYPGEGAYQSPSSPYAPWYRFKNWPREYACWWGFETLPEVEELSPEYLDYITGADGILARWQACGTAGWRLDVADELPDGFLDALRARVKAEDPEALVLGEVWEDASNKESYGHRRRYLLGRQLDSVMNYPFRQAVMLFLLEGNRTAFFRRVLTVTENYPPQVLRLLMNPLGTHDTERALTLLGGEPSRSRGRRWQAAQEMSPEQRSLGLRRLRLAAMMQYALPGVPCLYYGDEAGMAGYQDPFNRGTYPWGREEPGLPAWFAALGGLRRECAAMAEGAFVPVPSPEETVCFCREAGESGLLCAVNRSDREVSIPLPERYAAAPIAIGDGRVEDGKLILPGLSGMWIPTGIRNSEL